MANDKVIHLKGKSPSWPKTGQEFLEEFSKLVLAGYVLHPKPRVHERADLRFFPRATLVSKEYYDELVSGDIKEDTKEAVEDKVEAAEQTPLERLESLKKKDELLSFAAELGIEVDESLKMPKAISKHIKEQLETNG